MILTREDIGYGPARQYEPGAGPDGGLQRERRGTRRAPEPPATGELGPYHGRLRRKYRPDRWIQAEVEEELFLDTWVDADRITVDVRDGTVTLIGTLSNRKEVSNALRDARRVPGIRGVRNRLEVES